jgi:hypothetical protein
MRSWQLPATESLVTTVLQNPCFVNGSVFTQTDCRIRCVTLHCADPPSGFNGEITFLLSRVLYLDESSHFMSIDGKSSWPEGYSPRKTAVLELRWGTDDVLTLETPGSVVSNGSGGSNGQSRLQAGALGDEISGQGGASKPVGARASKKVGGSEQTDTHKL